MVLQGFKNLLEKHHGKPMVEASLMVTKKEHDDFQASRQGPFKPDEVICIALGLQCADVCLADEEGDSLSSS